MNIKENLEENIEIYAGMTIQKRAIVDVRDCLKPSARLSIYSQYIDKLIPSKPYEKSSVSVASAMRHFYPYGDAALYSMLARMGKPYAMRYKLEDFQGSTGDITEDDNQAAMRYTNMRLSKIAMNLFTDVEKETIAKWYNSYTDKEQYPSVLPSKGYYNIVNGSMGLAYAIAASIPQFNLVEVNEALIKLINNPNINDDDLICMPDFATGCTLLNADEVRQSLKHGNGSACKLRANVDYNKKDRTLVFTNTPYGTYTGTIAAQIQKIRLSEDNPGIENFWDQSTNEASIKVLLNKKANPEKVIRYLFKNTSLQNHYGINLIMLDNGKTPKLFTWKEALQAHIDHEKEVYRRGYEFDLKKIEDRLHIIEGLLKVIEDIDNVVRLIKTSESTSVARERLMSEYVLDEVQTKAILDMKLSRLAHLEVEKLKSEKSKLEKEREFIYNIINNESEFNAQLIKGWRDVANKFGDARRTQILNISKDDEEPTETQELLINLSNQNNIYVTTTSTLYSQRRGGVGNKFKMSKGEYVIATASGTNIDTVLLFSNLGNCFHLMPSELPFEEVIPIESVVELSAGERIEELVFLNKKKQKEHIIFFTKKGILKKSRLSEYNIKRKGGVKALNLDNNDEIVSILFVDNEQVGMMTARGQFILCETKDIRPIGRVARGVKGITLNDGDVLVSAKVIPSNTKEFLSVSEKGYIKRTIAKDFTITGRATKGSKIHSLKDNDDKLIAFAPIINERETIVVASNAQIKINLNEINLLSKGAQGTKSMKLSNAKIIGLLVV